jgi:hypothetical protein
MSERCTKVGLILLMVSLTAGCNKPQLGDPTADDGAPDEAQLRKIGYMATDNTGPKGRKVYSRLEQARSCQDLELALRWNRPPNIESGPFNTKMQYLTQEFPADLPKKTEVFIAGRIDRGQMMPSGGAGWLLRMKNGPVIQAVESADIWEKQQQDSQQGQLSAVVKPTQEGREFCGHGVYQGAIGKGSGDSANVPVVSMLFSMDRDPPSDRVSGRSHKRSGIDGTSR